MSKPLTDCVISLCDESGVFVRPWAEAGYESWCVDLSHPQAGRRDGLIHFVYGDARSWTPPAGRRICFVAGWPVCTNLAVSGARHFNAKGLRMLTDGLDLFNACHYAGAWSGAPFIVEQPVGVVSTHFRKPDYTFDPCDYAGYASDAQSNAYTKKTCLWTGGGFVMPEPRRVEPSLGSMMHLLPPSDDRAALRSKTPEGFARAVFLANHRIAEGRAA